MEISDLANQSKIQQQNQQSNAQAKTIAENFDVFLKLLTTQLKNQNPLEPTKTNEFTQQMVQFTGVEQQVKMNKGIDDLGKIFQQSAFTSSVNYIGRTVTAEGDKTSLQNSEASWEINMKEKPEKASVVITNAADKVVYSGPVTLKNGLNEFNWDGRSNDGNLQNDGLYTIKVNAEDVDGNKVVASTLTTGLVTGVDTTGTYGMLTIGNQKVKIDSVQRITA